MGGFSRHAYRTVLFLSSRLLLFYYIRLCIIIIIKIKLNSSPFSCGIALAARVGVLYSSQCNKLMHSWQKKFRPT